MMPMQVVILCAGFGKRMEGLTKECPKPMLTIAGRPLLEHTLSHLKALGHSDIIINVHYLAEQITDYFGDGSKFGMKITYIHEKEPSGTAGAVAKMKGLIHGDFLVLYGDVLCDENYSRFFDFHRSREGVVGSIIVHKRKKSNSVVVIDRDDGRVIEFWERPTETQLELLRQRLSPVDSNQESECWVNSGLYCFSPNIFKYLPDEGMVDFPKDIFPALVHEKALFAYPLHGNRIAIDDQTRYKMAQERIQEMFGIHH